MKSARYLKAAGLWISGVAWGTSGSELMRTAVALRSWGVASQAVDAAVSIISDNDFTSATCRDLLRKVRLFHR